MTNWEASKSIRDWRDCLGSELKREDYEWLKTECWKAKEQGDKANSSLIGHIKEEYNMLGITESLNEFILGACYKHKDAVKLSCLTENRPLTISNLWCNFQKKYEFNPPHDHSGLYSFVIFISVPYDLKKEEEYFGQIGGGQEGYHDSLKIHTSKFAFLNTNHKGTIACDVLNVDKSFEGKMILFNAKQIHQVFPFYTSDDYRITVSGNIRLLV
jgi:hypothetical protein|tara:strand:- start:71 stop:712 length:642 start_codon:yes stop_codon:yes gene_type:complete